MPQKLEREGEGEGDVLIQKSSREQCTFLVRKISVYGGVGWCMSPCRVVVEKRKKKSL